MIRTLWWSFLQAIVRVITSLLFDTKFYGWKNVPGTGGVLLASNHQSYLDPILVAVPLRRMVSFLAKSELFERRLFRWLIQSLNAFPVKQGAGDVGAMKETIRRLKEGHILTIFPEGSRTMDGEIQRIEPGIALVVRRAGVPVVPVVVDGAFDAWPKGGRPRSHAIQIMYGRPMILHDRRPEEIVTMLDRALKAMLAELRSRRHRRARRGYIPLVSDRPARHVTNTKKVA